MIEYEKKAIKEVFDINKFTFVPSIFGISCNRENEAYYLELRDRFNIRFEEDIFDENKDVFVEEDETSYYNKINEEVLKEISNKRAVLVFFEDKNKLNKCLSLLKTDN